MRPSPYVQPPTVREVERRVIRAMKTIRALPDKERKWIYGTGETCLARMMVQEWNAYGADEVRIPFRPTPFDVSDCLKALTWLRGLEKNEVKYFWWRSFDVSFAMIAAYTGRSDETARRRFKDVVYKAWWNACSQVSQTRGQTGTNAGREAMVA
jgi:hypothetical protein